MASSEVGTVYQLLNASTNAPIGATQTGNGATLAFPTGPITANTTYAISAVTAAPKSCASRLAQTATVTFNPLPVELTAFEAAAKNGGALLTWHTASEKNNDHFVVERSLNGAEFVAVGRVAGHGSTSQAHSYTFIDAASARLGTKMYYRLQQVDTDATTAYSPVRTVAFAEGTAPAQVLLYPNPASASVTLSLAYLPAGSYSVSITNLVGQTLRTVQLPAGQAHDLDIAALPAGLYVVRVQGTGLTLTQPLVKLR